MSFFTSDLDTKLHVVRAISRIPQQSLRLICLKSYVERLAGILSEIGVGQVGEVVSDPRVAVKDEPLLVAGGQRGK